MERQEIRILKEEVLVHLKVLSLHSPGQPEENVKRTNSME
jgi:hypothetical protein